MTLPFAKIRIRAGDACSVGANTSKCQVLNHLATSQQIDSYIALQTSTQGTIGQANRKVRAVVHFRRPSQSVGARIGIDCWQRGIGRTNLLGHTLHHSSCSELEKMTLRRQKGAKASSDCFASVAGLN